MKEKYLIANSYVWILFIYFFSKMNLQGQNCKDTTISASLSSISQINQGNSYVTFPTDIGNIEPLIFEGNLIPNFHIRQSKDSRLIGVITPQIIIRMYQEKSLPVRTPSYMPQITLFYRTSLLKNNQNLDVFLKIAHHSNGQENDFYLSNGTLNTKSGDFSTNYIEFGHVVSDFSIFFNAYRFYRSSFEFHPQGWSSKELEGIYSKYRWHNMFTIFKLASDCPDQTKRAHLSVKAELTWLFGQMGQTDSFSFDRINSSLGFYYYPKFLVDVGLFVQYYRGHDYYNMYFSRILNVVRFGIVTETVRF